MIFRQVSLRNITETKNKEATKNKAPKNFKYTIDLEKIKRGKPISIATPSDVLARLKQEASEKRFNFDRPLRELKAVFNWIIDRSEEPLSNPVRKFHFDDGKIKKIPKKNQKLTLEQVKDFFQSFSNNLYRDIARLQFLTGCRIQEIAGIKKSSIDLKNRRIVIKDVVVWGRDRKVLKVKPYTKIVKIRLLQFQTILFGM